MRRRTILVAGLAVVTAVSVLPPEGEVAGTQTAGAAAKAKRLKAFGSCAGLVRYARRHALRTLDDRRNLGGAPDALTAPEAGPQEEAQTKAPASPGVDYSPTNVQEAGIDEPDVVKTDGSHIFTVAAGKLHAVDVRGDRPRLAGSLRLEEGSGSPELLLHGERLIVISSSFQGVPGPVVFDASVVPPGQQSVQLTEVDVRDPSHMSVVRTLRADGAHVSSRLTGSTARIVISSQPTALAPSSPPRGSDPEQAERQAIERSRTSSWLPASVVHNRRTGRKSKHALVSCHHVRRAAHFSGLGMVTVLTVDLSKGLVPVDSDAVMTDAQTVYASPESLYVATERWLDPDLSPDRAASAMTTAIHKFDSRQPHSTAYRASGEVPGLLLNQFALSEHRGFLRAATTEQPNWLRPDSRRESESRVTVLEETGGRLAEVGRVGELGRGEEIYAVRFIEDVGYVVTFRQTDPLYTLDLADPTRPKVLGQLKIRGYSAYLHPVGERLLLGVGQDATERGQTLGTQLSLFDVSDLRRPVRLHQRTLGPASSSDVEYDHHAFLWWPPAKLAVLPVQLDAEEGAREHAFAGAIGFRIGRADGIAEVGRTSHGRSYDAAIQRALVVGDRLYTVSARGIEAASLETLAQTGSLAFPR